MAAIFKREFRAFFNGVLGWLFVAVTFAFMSLYFLVYNLLNGLANAGYLYGAVIFLYIVTIPILTMKIFAEDRKNKTDQMLYTAPVSLFKLVMGKYLALAAVFTIPVLISALFPIILSSYGAVPLGESYACALGYYLYGLAAIAIGLYISSKTENVIVAAVLTVLATFLVYVMTGIENIISSVPVLPTLLEGLNFMSRFEIFESGYIDLTAVLYFVTVIAVFIFLTIMGIKTRRSTFTKKNFARKTGSLLLTVIVIAALVAGNIGFSKIPEKYTSYNMESNKVYDITDDTRAVLEALTTDVTFYVYNTENSVDTGVRRTLGQYDEYEHITVEYIDPSEQPNFGEQYEAESLSTGSIVVVCGDKYKVVDYDDLYEYEVNYYTYSYDTTGYDAEGQLTSAIGYVTSTETDIVYVIGGNDELSLGSGFTEAITKLNAEVESVDLITLDEIPAEVSAIIILAPETDINEDEAQIIRDYLDNGGSMYVTLQYTQSPLTNFYSILEDYGIGVESGIITETDRSYYYQEADYLIPSLTNATANGTSGGDTVFMLQCVGLTNLTSDDDDTAEDTSDESVSLASALDADDVEAEEAAEEDDLSVYVLAKTSENAVLKTSPYTATTLDYEEGDETGEFSIGLAAEKGDTKVVVFASPAMTDDTVDSYISNYNSKLFGNVMSYLTGAEESDTSVAIPAKEISTTYVTVATKDIIVLGVTFIIIVPVVMIIIGIVIWVRRRKR